MVSKFVVLAVLSSMCLRVSAYIFLRWIPGHQFPVIVILSLIVYTMSIMCLQRPTRRQTGAPAVTQDQLVEITDGVVHLVETSAEAYEEVYSIIGEHVPSSEDDNYLEFDLEDLPDEVLEKLLMCIRSHIRRTPRKKKVASKHSNGSSLSSSTTSSTNSSMYSSISNRPGDLPPPTGKDVVRAVITGIPPDSELAPANGRFPVATALNVLINVLLVLMTLDLVLRAPLFYKADNLSFSRVGYVSDTAAKILIREPDPSQLPLYLYYKPTAASAFEPWTLAEKIYNLSNASDYTYAVTIARLQPSTSYNYTVTNNHTGTFTTAPSPVARNPSFTFLASSCMKARVPYSPFAHPLSIPGLDRLSKLVPRISPQFMLFLGDFIYIDVPLRLSSTVSSYRMYYRQVYDSPSSSALFSIPWLHVLDDHEISNDWASRTSAPYPAAFDAYKHYHLSVNPPTTSPNTTYSTFTRAPASFFLLDTRQYRSKPNPSSSMLGKAQLSTLLQWINMPPKQPNVHFKVIVSSVPFTQNWKVNAQDTWAGYPQERMTILRAMWKATAQQGVRFVVISGDRHEFAATRFVPPTANMAELESALTPTEMAVYEFSASPLSMFYLPLKTYKEDDVARQDWAFGREECLKYLPAGNSKVGSVQLESLEGANMGVLRYKLFIDGVEKWDYVVTSPEKKTKMLWN